MWKSDDATSGVESRAGAGSRAAGSEAAAAAGRSAGSGRSVIIKGELHASEDLTIEGQVEGKIEMLQNVLTVGTGARLHAEIFAKSVIVLGEVSGNVTVTEKLEIRSNGSVEGDIVAPKVAIAEGAHFRGRVEMRATGEMRPGAVTGRKPEAVPSARHAV